MAGSEHAGWQLGGFYVPAAVEGEPAQPGDQAVGLARHDEIDPREAAVGGLAHDGLAVRAAEHGDDLRVELADPAQQGQRRGVLLERRRAADHPGTGGEDLAGRLVHEPGRRGAQPHQLRDQGRAADPRQTAGCRSLASLICRRYSASSRARSASSPMAAAAKVHSPARNTVDIRDAHSSYSCSPALSANHRPAGATVAAMPSRSRIAASRPSAMDGLVSEA